MDFKLPFILLVFGVAVAGILPFGISDHSGVEPRMEINMLIDQTQNPFGIQDSTNQDVFAVKPNGGLDPIITQLTTYTMTHSWMDELFPTWDASSPNTIAPSSESGAGIYQFTHTITASDIDGTVDSSGMWTSDNFLPIMYYQLRNLDGGSITGNFKLFLNDVEIGTTGARIFAGNDYGQGIFDDREQHNGATASIPYPKENDVIGFKFWQSAGVPDSLRLNHVWLEGQPELTTVALNFSIEDMTYSVYPNVISKTIPSEFSGVTMQGRAECFTEHFNDWDQCLGQNAFSGDGTGQIGSLWMHHSQGGDSLSTHVANQMWFTDDFVLRDGGKMNVVTWK